LFLFTRAILAGQPVDVFNHGKMRRDFTYIDDIADGVVLTLDRPAEPLAGFDVMRPDPARSWAPYQVLNIGRHGPAGLLEYLDSLEEALGRKAERRYLPMQPGDVEATFADTGALQKWTGFAPSTSIREGIKRFVDWYLDFYKTESK
jgi:UDP-glucuronate 4-epimerase